MRKDAREAVFRILYADIFNKENDDGFVNEVYGELALTGDDRQFADRLLTTIRSHIDEIDDNIRELSVGYKLERLYPTDKSALTLAIAEITYFDDVPNVVAIDEALTLVRKYSTEESLRFVNGILASYKKKAECKNEDN